MPNINVSTTIDPADFAEQLVQQGFEPAIALIKKIEEAAQDAAFTLVLARYFAQEAKKFYAGTEDEITADDLFKGPTSL